MGRGELNMSEELETVEVVYSDLWQLVLILILGMFIGFVCGTGMAFGKLEKLAQNPPKIVINGDMSVESNNGHNASVNGGYYEINGSLYLDTSKRNKRTGVSP